MFRYFVILPFTPLFIYADELTTKANESIHQSMNRIPALEILPAGSILKNIRIPRYNKNYTTSSLLTADQLKVINDKEIHGSNVSISLYDETGKIKTRSTLNSVNYNQASGLIASRENLEFSGGSFIASGQGLILDWQNHRGFLLGKNKSLIYINKRSSMNKSNKQTLKTSSKANRIAIASAAVVAASTPSIISAKELAEIDAASQPSTKLFIKQLDETKANLIATAEAEAKIAAIRKELTEKLGPVPAVDPAQANPVELKPVKGKDFISITSDQLLFDAKKGVFVYFGNVRITHPKYFFSCAGELKIILKESASAQKLKPNERAKLKANDLFDDVQQIIATNNIIVRGKDKEGKDVSAVTENLSYNKATGTIILKGKGSRITTADAQLKVVENDGYLMLDQDFNASGKGADTNYIVPEEPDKPKDKPKKNK